MLILFYNFNLVGPGLLLIAQCSKFDHSPFNLHTNINDALLGW